METDKYNYVGTCIKLSSGKKIYYPGPEGMAYFKNKDYLLHDSMDRQLCYIPATMFTHKDEHGKKCFIDKWEEPQPELTYTTKELYYICGFNGPCTMLMFHLLNGAIPERFFKVLIKEELITLSPAYMTSKYPEYTDIYCKRSHPWVFTPEKDLPINKQSYMCDFYWYREPEMLLHVNAEWATSINNNMYQAWHLTGAKFFGTIPESRYDTWGYELLKAEVGDGFNDLRVNAPYELVDR